MKNIVKGKGGCGRYDCESHPYYETFGREEFIYRGEIIYNRSCTLCKYFKPFDFYVKVKDESK